MLNVEAEVNRYKNCRDRDELEKRIKEYKDLALHHSKNITAAGLYNKVALKLQEIYNKLPAPNLKNLANSKYRTPVKTAKITNEESAKINADWKQRAGKTDK
jgi:hypothetical protein